MPGGGGDNLLPTIVSQSYGKQLNPIIVPVGTTFDLYCWGIVTPGHEGEYELGFDWYSGSYFDADPYATPLGSGSVSMVVYPGGVYDPDPPVSIPLYYNDYTGSIITLSASAFDGETYVYWMRLSQSMLPSATLAGGYAYGQDVYVTFTGSAPTGSTPTGSTPTASIYPTIISQSIGTQISPIQVLIDTPYTLFVDGIIYPPSNIGIAFEWYSGSSPTVTTPLGSGSVSMVSSPGGFFPPTASYDSYTSSLVSFAGVSTVGETYVYWMRLSGSTNCYTSGNNVYVNFITASVPTGSVPTGSVPTSSIPTPGGSWKGNPTNPVPNPIREPIGRSEKPVKDNRALHVRRDTDGQKNITIGLYDIDETILLHLERLNLQVTDNGQIIKVPIFYGSPEIWIAARRDGYIRDKQGKIILPVMTLKRTNSGDEDTLKYFNRYLHLPVMKKYSTKNKYTQFSLLSGQNAPVNEVYNIVFPSHLKLTYHFIIWTEYVEQMNTIVENIRFNTGDYWGSKQGFKFRTSVDGFGHTTELQVGDDRIVKTEFDLITHGYILPETITTLENQRLTTEKFFTPKKMIVNSEVVATDFDLTEFDANREKWRNQNYPNLPKDEVIPPPGVAITEPTDNSSIAGQIVSTLKYTTAATPPQIISDTISNVSPYLKVVPPPPDIGGSGKDGDVAYDDQYIYIYAGTRWRRVAISQFE